MIIIVYVLRMCFLLMQISLFWINYLYPQDRRLFHYPALLSLILPATTSLWVYGSAVQHNGDISVVLPFSMLLFICLIQFPFAVFS